MPGANNTGSYVATMSFDFWTGVSYLSLHINTINLVEEIEVRTNPSIWVSSNPWIIAPTLVV